MGIPPPGLFVRLVVERVKNLVPGLNRDLWCQPEGMSSVQHGMRNETNALSPKRVHKESNLQLPPCRLLYVVGQLALGGAERQLYYLLATLDHARYRPALVAWNYNPDEKYYRDIVTLKIPVYGLPSGGSPLAKLKAFRKLAQRVSAEVIHSYGFHTNFAAYFAARAIGAVPVGSLRSDFATIKRVGGVVRGALNARWPQHHIANSVVCAEAARRDGGFFSPRTFSIVRNGLDLKSFHAADNPQRMRTYVAGIGSLLTVKRWDRLLRAVQMVKTAIAPGVQFRIAGDGPLKGELESLARELGIQDVVTFVGSILDIPAFLNGAHFLVHTSESEGCPNVVMEAMAAGRAVVATDAGDIPYLVENGETGFVVRRDDDESLADRMITLLGNPTLREYMESNARAKAERDFQLEALVDGTLAAYRLAGWHDHSGAAS